MPKGFVRPTGEKRKPRANAKKNPASLAPSQPAPGPAQAEPSEMYKLFTKDRSFP